MVLFLKNRDILVIYTSIFLFRLQKIKLNNDQKFYVFFFYFGLMFLIFVFDVIPAFLT